MCYAFVKNEIAYWKHVSHWNGKAMKNENHDIFMYINQLYLRYTRQFRKMLRKWKFPIFQRTSVLFMYLSVLCSSEKNGIAAF